MSDTKDVVCPFCAWARVVIKELRDDAANVFAAGRGSRMAELAKQQAEIERLTRERDERENVTRRLLNSAEHGGDSRQWWVERHPWLKEGE
jgi:hypothetical protein